MEDKDINKKDVYADFLKTIPDHISDEVDEYVEMINQAYELGKRDARLEHETTMPPNEDIDKAASEYTEECNSRTPIATNNSFCAGAEWAKTQMQSEIDELREALEEFHKTWESVADVFPSLNNQPCYIKATKLLKRYENKINNT